MRVPLTSEEFEAAAVALPPDAEGGYVMFYVDPTTRSLSARWVQSLVAAIRASASLPGTMTRLAALGQKDVAALLDRRREIASGF